MALWNRSFCEICCLNLVYVIHPWFCSAAWRIVRLSWDSSMLTEHITRFCPVWIILNSLPSLWRLSTAFLRSLLRNNKWRIDSYSETSCALEPRIFYKRVRHSFSSRNPPFFFLKAIQMFTIWIYNNESQSVLQPTHNKSHPLQGHQPKNLS